MSLYDDLIDWSLGLPGWQRDALRRLAIQEQVSPEDIEELVTIAAPATHTPGDRVATPIAAEHLPLSTSQVPTQLLAIEIGENVNAIAPASRLEFAADGLTVVYGDNATGKSGYVRVLKRVCRTRGQPEQVLPNVLRSDPRAPSAIVEFRSADRTMRATWHPAAHPPGELGAVTVFDRSCAAVYVNAENEVAYSPLGLDLFDRLVAVMQQVRRRLEALRAELNSQRLTPPTEFTDSPSLRAIWPPKPDVQAAAIQLRINWTAEEDERLEQVAAALSVAGPLEIARGMKAREAALLRAVAACERAEEAMRAAHRIPAAKEKVVELTASIQRLHEAVSADESLSGVGGDLWRALWRAAERFSSDAYPGHAFPNTSPDARCVLCGQPLSATARERFERLRALVGNELQSAREAAEATLEKLMAATDAFSRLGDPIQHLADLEASEPEAFALARTFMEQVSREVAGADTDSGPFVAAEHKSPAEALRHRVTTLQAKISVLERATNADERVAMAAELRELRARRWIHENSGRIVDESARRLREKTVDAAIASCDTTPVTQRASELTLRYVTDALRKDFEAELKALDPTRVPVRIVRRGAYGSTYHRLQVATASTLSAKIGEVVSDGEFRGLALANLFAETQSTTGCSAIVLDDPVTSLDHRFRTRVAERLTRQAATRQVIVFTHDLVFVQDLAHAAEVAGVSIAYARLSNTLTHVGHPLPEPPWDGMKLKQRAEALQLELNSLRTLFESGDLEGYERGVPRWYSRLRSTWERGVEEVLFGDAVNRFRSQIKTNNLVSEKVWHLDERDVREVESAMTKCSAWTDAHDEPAAANRQPPQPNELRQDLVSLRGWMTRIKENRR